MSEGPAETFGVRCGDCGSPMEFRPRGFYGRGFWGCSQFPTCRGTHSADSSGAPLGVPGDKATRAARVGAHRVFDAAWKARGMTRQAAYSWLQELTGKSRWGAHISRLSEKECYELIDRVRIAEAVRSLAER